MGGRHSPEEIAQFTGGETAQVVARDRRDGSLVFLHRGQAAAVRPLAVQSYECPVADCSAPSPLSTRGGSKRDHFWHRAPHSHPGGDESLFHLEGKHRIATWARNQGAVHGVRVDVSEEVWDSDANRRADVMVTWPDGRRVAFEIEYKAPTITEWHTKDADYRRNGIVGVWLFGHHPSRHLRPDTRVNHQPRPGEPPRFRLTPLTEAVVKAGKSLMFINPTEGQIGTMYEAGEPLEAVEAASRWWWQRQDPIGDPMPPRPDRKVVSAHLGIAGLDDCRLDPTSGIVTPTTVAIDQERQRINAARVAARARLAADDREARRRHAEHRDELMRLHALNPPPPPQPDGVHRCPVCGDPLNPILSKHLMACGPRWPDHP